MIKNSKEYEGCVEVVKPFNALEKLTVMCATLSMFGSNSHPTDAWCGEPFKDLYEPLGHEPSSDEWDLNTAYAQKVAEALYAASPCGDSEGAWAKNIDTSKLRTICDELDALAVEATKLPPLDV